MIPLLTISLVLISCHERNDVEDDLDVDNGLVAMALEGKLEGDRYVNSSLGFSVSVPDGWIVQEPESIRSSNAKPLAYNTDRPGPTIIALIMHSPDKARVVKIEAYSTSSITIVDPFEYATDLTRQMATSWESIGAKVSTRVAGDLTPGRPIPVGMLNVQTKRTSMMSIDIYFIRNGAISFDVGTILTSDSQQETTRERTELRDLVMDIEFSPVDSTDLL